MAFKTACDLTKVKPHPFSCSFFFSTETHKIHSLLIKTAQIRSTSLVPVLPLCSVYCPGLWTGWGIFCSMSKRKSIDIFMISCAHCTWKRKCVACAKSQPWWTAVSFRRHVSFKASSGICWRVLINFKSNQPEWQRTKDEDKNYNS